MPIFVVLFLLLFGLLVVGLVKPTLFGFLKLTTRLRTGLVFGSLALVSLFLVGATSTKVEQAKQHPIGALAACLPEVSAPGARQGADQPDETPGYQVHAVYALPNDAEDQHLDTDGKIARSMSAFQNWLCTQTDKKSMRLDTSKGKLDISFVRLGSSNAALKADPHQFETITAEVKAAGYKDPNKVYAIYYGGLPGISCGRGGDNYAYLFRGGEAQNMVGLHCDNIPLATDYTYPMEGDLTMLHEILHALGFVPSCAPHSTSGSHVLDSAYDIMYQSGEVAGAPHPAPGGPKTVLDYNHDDYYGTTIPGCPDLAKSAYLVGGGSELPAPLSGKVQ